jgi:hypothetical protein
MRPANFCIFSESTPLITTCSLKVPIACTFDHLDLILESDPMSRRNLIVDVLALSSISKLDWEHDFSLKPIIQVEATPVLLV